MFYFRGEPVTCYVLLAGFALTLLVARFPGRRVGLPSICEPEPEKPSLRKVAKTSHSTR
jgi:hypothetical protein